jgi:PiT family inorganic phosphate transporter
MLFTLPLIFAAALLSFAHGANDVANAVGPLAAIYDTIIHGDIAGSKAVIPIWVMLVGALGIAIGLALYGPRLIKTVGSEITELDATRAYSIAMASALTVIIASQLGLPVSTTHIAIGGVFGVGFLREYLAHKRKDELLEEENQVLNKATKNIANLSNELQTLEEATTQDYKRITEIQQQLKKEETTSNLANKNISEITEANYVQKSFVSKIVSAWIITVPIAAVLSAMIFFIIRGIMI